MSRHAHPLEFVHTPEGTDVLRATIENVHDNPDMGSFRCNLRWLISVARAFHMYATVANRTNMTLWKQGVRTRPTCLKKQNQTI